MNMACQFVFFLTVFTIVGLTVARSPITPRGNYNPSIRNSLLPDPTQGVTCDPSVSIGVCVDDTCDYPGYVCAADGFLCCPTVDYTNPDCIDGDAVNGVCPEGTTPVPINGTLECILLNCGTSSDLPMASSDMPTMETMQPTWGAETTTSRASTQGPPGKCPAGWLTAASRPNTCYYVYDAAVVDYFNALRFCQNLHNNSHVLVIHNGFENNLITTSTVWLGLDSRSGDWAWSDGETSSYRNWATGQPGSDNSCSVLNRSTGKWSSVDCDSRLPLICQLYF